MGEKEAGASFSFLGENSNDLYFGMAKDFLMEKIDILNVKMDCLANTIEKNVSQYKYIYQIKYGELS